MRGKTGPRKARKKKKQCAGQSIKYKFQYYGISKNFSR